MAESPPALVEVLGGTKAETGGAGVKNILDILQLAVVICASIVASEGNVPFTILFSAIIVWVEIFLLRKDLEGRHDR